MENTTPLQSNDPHHQNGPQLSGDDSEERSGVKVIGVTIVLLLVLAVLYWGGRRLLAPAAPPESGGSESLASLLPAECSRRNYTSVDAALQAAEVVCMVHLADQSMQQLSPTIGQLTELRSLSLARNQLSSLPPEITALTELFGLSLSHNNFTEFPEQVLQFKKLRGLLIAENQITQIPDTIGDLSELRTLDLRGNPLSPTQVERVRAVLPNTHVLF